jgi:hypothetical protein
MSRAVDSRVTVEAALMDPDTGRGYVLSSPNLCGEASGYVIAAGTTGEDSQRSDVVDVVVTASISMRKRRALLFREGFRNMLRDTVQTVGGDL